MYGGFQCKPQQKHYTSFYFEENQGTGKYDEQGDGGDRYCPCKRRQSCKGKCQQPSRHVSELLKSVYYVHTAVETGVELRVVWNEDMQWFFLKSKTVCGKQLLGLKASP